MGGQSTLDPAYGPRKKHDGGLRGAGGPANAARKIGKVGPRTPSLGRRANRGGNCHGDCHFARPLRPRR